ncbi:MAG: hypothetical protein OEM41_05690, partial [Ignavibacteria bacterium]|nr:hypothetical protein [Ignavibacteria bacterium]
QEGRSQEIISQLNGLLGGAREELNQLLGLNQQAEQQGEGFQTEYKDQLNKYGIKGRWIDKLGEWEQWYQQYGADKVALAQKLHEGFEGGAPGGQLSLLFDLMEEYSDKVPILGRFIKLYAQVGKEMLNAAIRAGQLIRQREQGCLGTGTHSGFKDWYNLGDPVNVAFGEKFPGNTACPSAIENIFEDITDNSLLYFWTGESFLVGASGNGGIRAIFSIQAFLRRNGYETDAENLSTLHQIYNMNFPNLVQTAEDMVAQIERELARLQELQYDCGLETFEQLLKEKAGFAFDYKTFVEKREEILNDMLVDRIIHNDASLWNAWRDFSEGLGNLRPVVQAGKVVQSTENGIGSVANAQVVPQVTNCTIYQPCTQLQTSAGGRFKVLFLVGRNTTGEVRFTASKDGTSSDVIERLVEPNRPYPNDITLELEKTERVPVGLTVSPGETQLKVGETVNFKALVTYEDTSVADVTSWGETKWSGGTNTFKAEEAGTYAHSVTYRSFSASATVTVEEAHACPDDQHWDEEKQACVCDKGEWNEELGKCINLDEAIGEVTEEGELCDEEALSAQLARLGDLVAESARVSANFQVAYNKFLKEINDQNANPCENNILAVAYAGAKRHLSDYQTIVDEATELSTNLILQAGLCPDLRVNLNISQILARVGQLGGPFGQIKEGIAEMESQLLTFGCDEQEVSEQGDRIAEQTDDPEVIQAGGAGGQEICGDGIDNDGDGLIDEGCEAEGNFNVIIVLFDSGQLADDIFGLSVSGQGNLGTTPEGGARTYPLSLSPGSYVATITVISAPDDVGTFTIRVLEGDREIAGQIGSPPQGSQINVPFTVGQNPGQTSTIMSLPLLNFEREIEQPEPQGRLQK